MTNKDLINRNRGLQLLVTRYERALKNILKGKAEDPMSGFVTKEQQDHWVEIQFNRIKAGKSRYSTKSSNS